MYSVTVLAHRLLGALLLPPILNLLPIIAGGMLIRRWPHAGRLLLASGVALTYFLSIPQTAIWLAHGLERYPVIDAAQLADVDAIVVLGGGKRPAEEFGGNAPGSDTLTRLRYGAYLARASGKPLLVTGGAPSGGEAEGAVMARALREDYGLKPRWVELRSNTTLENAQLSAPMLQAAGVKRIALVSQGWHLARAVPFFQRQGLQVLPAPTGLIRYDGAAAFLYIPSGNAMAECRTLLSERLGLLFYRIRPTG
ncbi:YdcF family protein [Chromobacterium subtsugae]|uniref:YdcF family protein n=1 Tax=Chromobacterium subtsugae TaxID=251747 RepID=UPI0006414757|nr:YdcF family protein [Chromobacterium subtsugae]